MGDDTASITITTHRKWSLLLDSLTVGHLTLKHSTGIINKTFFVCWR